MTSEGMTDGDRIRLIAFVNLSYDSPKRLNDNVLNRKPPKP